MGYNIFISYRREGGDILSMLLYSRLKADGYMPFLDVESLRSGMFNTQLYDRIAECKDFVVVLPPLALERCENQNDWLRLEISRAIQLKKNIVPILMRSFVFPAELPDDIGTLPLYNGINASTEYFDAMYAKLKNMLQAVPSNGQPARPDAPDIQLGDSATRVSVCPQPTAPVAHAALAMEPLSGGEYKITACTDPYITEIDIPTNVRVIGVRAFCHKQYLTKVAVPDSVQIIEDEAFADCPHLEITIPATVRFVGKDVLRGTATEQRQKQQAEEEIKRKAQEFFRKADEDLFRLGNPCRVLEPFQPFRNRTETEYLYFGTFPQTIKDKDVGITDHRNHLGYYLGSDGAYYAKAMATPYSRDYRFSNSIAIRQGETYYFKVEPIKWRIYIIGDFSVLHCNNILANLYYDAETPYYLHSHIRHWLNNIFYTAAFTDFQRSLIIPAITYPHINNFSVTDNIPESVEETAETKDVTRRFEDVGTRRFEDEETGFEEWEKDKVWLLSQREVTANGFAAWNETDSNRYRITTDYARCLGCNMETEHPSLVGNGFWWLRTGEKENKFSSSSRKLAKLVTPTGEANGSGNIKSAYGVAPALIIERPMD